MSGFKLFEAWMWVAVSGVFFAGNLISLIARLKGW